MDDIGMEITMIRRKLKSKIIDLRGPWCELCLLNGKWVIGSDLHEFIVKRGAVSRQQQVLFGLFCLENCGLLCQECHKRYGQWEETKRKFIKVQIARGYPLNPVTGLWPAWEQRGEHL